MSKLNEKEIKVILEIENRKKRLAGILDDVINEMTYVRTNERFWWREMVVKYKLNPNKLHRIWIDGEILEERRKSHGRRKIL
jgi:transposase